MHRLTDSQGRQLEAIMLATRPDWAHRSPGKMLQAANMTGFIHAADFAHMVRALAVYATLPGTDGQPFGRGPDGYARPGHHWTTTAPQGFEVPRGPRCETHTTYYLPCPCCRADRIAEKPEAVPTGAASVIQESK